MKPSPSPRVTRTQRTGVCSARNTRARVAAMALDQAPATGPADEELERLRHATIQRVTADLDRFKFNTAVQSLVTTKK